MSKSFQAFRSLPAALQAYLLVWYALGATAVVISACHVTMGQGRSIMGYMAVALLLNIKTVRGRETGADKRATISLASAASFGAIVGIGPYAGVPVELFGTVLDSVYPKRRTMYQALFNISVCSVATLASGWTYSALGGVLLAFGEMSPVIAIAAAAGPMIVASLIYYGINTLGVAEVVALATGGRPWEVWKRSFGTSFVSYATGAACAVLVLGLSGHMSLVPLLTLCGPILYACHSREQSDEARVVALEKGKERLQGMYLASIRTLAHTVAAKDRYTNGHVHRVAAYAAAIAQQMGLSEDEITDVKTGALLHDIGKIGVPEYILTKPGRLTDEEMAAMRRHSEVGWAILEPIGFPQSVKTIVRNHHEWYNGAGYPDGLHGDALPLLARIVAVSDVFDALTSDRPYRGALCEAEAREILFKNAGTQFDPTVLSAFLQVLDVIPYQELGREESDSPALTEILDALDEAAMPPAAPDPQPAVLPAMLRP
ncbi:MAG TPA: HD-GYP domain-containing protein [Armatimonadota bacterium]|jgi:putative nucleotidyltransferase with HDIG domain